MKGDGDIYRRHYLDVNGSASSLDVEGTKLDVENTSPDLEGNNF